jgi:MFS family permease
VFGLGEFLPKSPLTLVATFVVLSDAVMSFFGSVGYDAGFSIWTTDISNEHNRGRLGGALAVMPVIAMIIGMVGFGLIIEKLDYFPFFVIIGATIMLFGLVALLSMKDAPDLAPRRDEPTYWKQLTKVFNWRTVKENRELFWVFIVMLVFFVGFNVYFSYIMIYFINYLGFSTQNAGIMLGTVLALASLMTLPAGRLIERGHLVQVIFYSVLSSVTGLIIVSLTETTVLLYIGMFLASCGYILTMQTLTAWIKNLYPEEQRGQFEGIKQVFFVALPMVFGPMIAEPVIDHFGVSMVINGVAGMVPGPSLFLVSAAVTALTILPLVAANRMHKQNRTAAQGGANAS